MIQRASVSLSFATNDPPRQCDKLGSPTRRPNPPTSHFSFSLQDHFVISDHVAQIHLKIAVSELNIFLRHTYAIFVVASLFLTMGDGQCARDTRPLPKTSRNNAALGMIGGAFARILALTAPFVVRQLRSSLSYSATPRRKVERALKYVLSRRTSEAAVGRHGHDGRRPPHDQALCADPRRPPPSRYRYVDLGAGDGAATLSAAVLGFAAMGVELNPTL